MSWTVTTTARFDRAAKKLDRVTATRVLKTLDALADLDDPASRCKALSGPLTGLWRLRVGDWRIILDIQQGTLTVLALDLGH